MPSYKAKTHQEALKLIQLMSNHSAAATLQMDHRTIEYWNRDAWKRVRKQWAQMQVVRRASESKSMMVTKELL